MGLGDTVVGLAHWRQFFDWRWCPSEMTSRKDGAQLFKQPCHFSHALLTGVSVASPLDPGASELLPLLDCSMTIALLIALAGSLGLMAVIVRRLERS